MRERALGAAQEEAHDVGVVAPDGVEQGREGAHVLRQQVRVPLQHQVLDYLGVGGGGVYGNVTRHTSIYTCVCACGRIPSHLLP